jgi:hypothetical protein
MNAVLSVKDYNNLDELPADIGVLFAIFCKVHLPGGDPDITVKDYMKKCGKPVEAVGRVFIWLGLAKADKRSPFGFKATSTLMQAMVEQSGRGRVRATLRDDAAVFCSIYDAALSPVGDWFGTESFVVECLIVAGLARESVVSEDVLATPLLRQLAGLRRILDRSDARAQARKKAKLVTKADQSPALANQV